MEDEGFFVCSAFSVAGSIAVKAYLEVRMVMMMMMMILMLLVPGDRDGRRASPDHHGGPG